MKCQECGREGTGDVCAVCGGTIEESPRWYAEGIAHLTEQKQYAIAFDLLEEGIERYPQSAMLWYNGGVLEELLNNRDGAIRRYQQVLELRPNNDKARKALERLLGRPLYTPQPTSYAAQAPAAPVAPPTQPAPQPAVVTLPEPPPAPVAAPVAAAPLPDAPAISAPPVEEIAAPPMAPPSGERELMPSPFPMTEAPEAAPLAPAPGGLPWKLISMICGLASIATFISMLTFAILKISLGFTLSIALFSVALIVHFAARALAMDTYGRRRR